MADEGPIPYFPVRSPTPRKLRGPVSEATRTKLRAARRRYHERMQEHPRPEVAVQEDAAWPSCPRDPYRDWSAVYAAEQQRGAVPLSVVRRNDHTYEEVWSSVFLARLSLDKMRPPAVGWSPYQPPYRRRTTLYRYYVPST